MRRACAVLLAAGGLLHCGGESEGPGPGPTGTAGSAPSTTTPSSSTSSGSSGQGGTGASGPAASWTPVTGFTDACDGVIEMAEPAVAAELLPPLQWDPCTMSIPCEQWRVNFPADLTLPVFRSNHYSPRGQVAVYLSGDTHRSAAVYELSSGLPLAAWRSPLGNSCFLTPIEPAGDVIWAGLVDGTQNSGPNTAFHFRLSLATGGVERAPFESGSLERWATPTMLLAELGNGSIDGWVVGEPGLGDRIGELGMRIDAPSITRHGVISRHRPQSAPPLIRAWDPVTKETTTLVTTPAAEGVLVVRATDDVLWWVSVDGSDAMLYSAPLGGPSPLPATPLHSIRAGIADVAASSDFFAYHSSNDEKLVVINRSGEETVYDLPTESPGIRNLSFAGHDGQYPNTVWFDSGRGMFRLRIPLD
ncbi:MAG: hypothetical protein AAGA56_11330 [Myxococcota bacterium]